MSKTSKNQRGFSAVEGLLVVIIVLLVGFIGYYVWHTNRNTDKTLGLSSTTSQNAKTGNQQNSKYLAVKEWAFD